MGSNKKQMKKGQALERKRKWPSTYKEMHRRAKFKGGQTEAKLGLAPLFQMRGEAVEVRTKRNAQWLLVVPDVELQRQLITQAHLERGAHLNARSVERQLRRRYWWWDMTAMCQQHTDNCVHCQRHKSRSQQPSGRMAEVEEPTTMGIGYSVDFLTCLFLETSVGTVVAAGPTFVSFLELPVLCHQFMIVFHRIIALPLQLIAF